MPRVSRKLSDRKFRCLKFSEGCLVFENICTQKLQIRNFVDTKISRFTVFCIHVLLTDFFFNKKKKERIIAIESA